MIPQNRNNAPRQLGFQSRTTGDAVRLQFSPLFHCCLISKEGDLRQRVLSRLEAQANDRI